MKRVFYLMLLIWQQQTKLYINAIVIGALVGVFILAPSYDYIYARQHLASPFTSVLYVFQEVGDMLTGRISHQDLILLMFYAEIGAVLGVLSLVLYTVFHNKLQHINFLQTELDKDLPSIIRQGEGAYIEFKSSLRWDIVESRVNRNLETVILKTVTGFLNSSVGGTLLIGVADNGEIIGLDKDFQTLKKPNQDGFELALMGLVSSNLGADVCPFIHVLFHVIDQKQVCRVIVSPASRPVFLEQANTPKFFVRTGGATRDLNIKEALSFVSDRWPRKN